MRSTEVSLIGALIAMTAATMSVAANIGDERCSDALVMSTYKSVRSDQRDYRLADLITSDQYDQMSKDSGGSGSAFGYSLSGNYSEYRNRVQQDKQQHNESLDTATYHNVLWTYLDPNGATAYSRCVELASSQGGLSLFIKSANAQYVTLWLRWRPRSIEGVNGIVNEPASIALSWGGHVASDLPTSIAQGDGIPIIVMRDNSNLFALAVHSGGMGQEVVVTPMPPPPPPPGPPPAVVYSGRHTWSDATTSSFDFDKAESASTSGVISGPWTYSAEVSGVIQVSAVFEVDVPATYLSCAISILGSPPQPVALSQPAGPHGGPPVTECAVDAKVTVKAGDQLRVGFGKAGSTRGNPNTIVTGRVTTSYLLTSQ